MDDDPMGMKHLFQEQPSGDSTTLGLAASAAADTAVPPWAEVLQLSLHVLTKWMHLDHRGLVGLAAQHVDAVLYLLTQADNIARAPASTTQAADPSTDAGSGASIHTTQDSLAESFRAFHDVLLQLVQADESSWLCDHIVRSTLIAQKTALVSRAGSNGTRNRVGVVGLAATCLLSRVQSCLARGQSCQLAMDLWVDLVGNVGSAGITEAQLMHQKAPFRYESNSCACLFCNKSNCRLSGCCLYVC